MSRNSLLVLTGISMMLLSIFVFTSPGIRSNTLIFVIFGSVSLMLGAYFFGIGMHGRKSN